jgi:ABC-2 type transport system permease protein
MNKLWHVAWYEYRRHVFTRRFVLAGLLSVPLILLVMAGLVLLIISLGINTTPLGYVDHSGLLSNPVPAPAPEWPDQLVPMLPFETEAAARSALDAGQIQAYYVLPADYLSTGQVSVFHMGAFQDMAKSRFDAFLTANLLRGTDPAIANRLVKGSEIIIRTVDGSRSTSSQNALNVILPMVAGIVFIVAMFSTGGYLMQAVVEEKENRTMEVIITSVSPNQFMAGKIIGDMAIGLTQILLWSLFVIIPFLVLRNTITFLQSIQIASQTLFLLAFIMFPSFILVAALMAAIGATVAEAREGQQIISIFSLPIWIPYMLVIVIMQNPNSPLAVALSMIPLTAPLTMLMRDGATTLPVWQIALSSAIQILGAVGAIWLAGRAFRLGMLRYGQRLKWREIFAKN